MSAPKFRNEVLRLLVEKMQKAGWKVYTFKTDGPIGQVFYVHEDKIGTAHEKFGGISIGTVHKPNISCGTGFGVGDDMLHNPTIEDAKEGFMFCPHWYNNTSAVKKYANWDEYVSKETILTYYELTTE